MSPPCTALAFPAHRKPSSAPLLPTLILLFTAAAWAPPAQATGFTTTLFQGAPTWANFQKPMPKGVALRGGHKMLSLPPSKQTPRGPHATNPSTQTKRQQPLTQATNRPANCRRLLWFTAAAQQPQGDIKPLYEAALIAAMMSAQQNAPSLYPYLIYQPYPGLTTRPRVVEWFASMGGTVVNHTLSFRDSLDHSVKAGAHREDWLMEQGTFLRVDLPLIMKNLETPPDAPRDYVLYTDVDVLFEADIHSCSLPKPRNMLIGPESRRGQKDNAGVLYINMTSLAENHRGLVAWGHKNQWPRFRDQTLLLEYYKDGAHGGLQLLPDQYNWKGYWGAPTAADNGPAVIVHFHGPKPMRCLECFILHSLQIDYCGTRDLACKAYAPLWRLAPDGGQYMAKVLQQFYMYLGLATSPVLR